MLLQERSSLDISSGALESRAFDVKVDAEMIYTLISGIAKDKIGYMVREMSSNAADYSPVDKPFELHLPTRLSPNIRWRDYGPSMNHEFVMKRATTIGDSGSRTFSEDNRDAIDAGLLKDKLGGFGLGSKSPFGYLIASSADGGGSFTVRCFQQGVVRTYLMGIANNGRPECRFFGETTTNELDGTEVAVAVRQEDIGPITNAAHKILWTFEPQPVITPAPANWPTLDEATVSKADNWRLLTNSTPLGTRPWVRMGSVAYPIEFDQLLTMEDRQWAWKNAAILFDVPVGSLKPIRSREALEYTDLTRSTITSLLRKFEAGIAASFTDELKDKKTWLEACAYADQKSTNSIGLRRLIDNKSILFNGVPIERKFKGERSDLTMMPVHELQPYYGYDASFLVRKSYGGGRPTEWEVEAQQLKDIKAVAVYAPNRICERIKEAKVPMPMLLVKGEKAADFASKFGLPVFDLTKVKLPKQPYLPGTRTKTMRKVDMVVGADLHPTVIDLDEGGIFATKHNHGYRRKVSSLSIEGGSVGLSSIAVLTSSLRAAELIDDQFKVYVFPTDKPPTGKKWTPLERVLKDTILPKLDLTEYRRIKSISGNISHNHLKLIRILNWFAPDAIPADIRQVLLDVKAMVDQAGSTRTPQEQALVQAVIAFNAVSNIPTDKATTVNDLCTEKVGALNDKHPIFSLISEAMPFYDSYGAYARHKGHFAEYFKLILNQKG